MLSKDYWIIVIERVDTAEESILQDRYNHGPEKFRTRGDALSRAAKMNGKMRYSGQHAVVRKWDEPAPEKRLKA